MGFAEVMGGSLESAGGRKSNDWRAEVPQSASRGTEVCAVHLPLTWSWTSFLCIPAKIKVRIGYRR